MRTISEATACRAGLVIVVQLVKDKLGFSVVTTYRNATSGKRLTTSVTDLYEGRKQRLQDKATAMRRFALQCSYVGATSQPVAMAA